MMCSIPGLERNICTKMCSIPGLEINICTKIKHCQNTLNYVSMLCSHNFDKVTYKLMKIGHVRNVAVSKKIGATNKDYNGHHIFIFSCSSICWSC